MLARELFMDARNECGHDKDVSADQSVRLTCSTVKHSMISPTRMS